MSMDIVSHLRSTRKGEKTAQAAADEIEKLRAEVERLNSCLRYEQHRAERVGTHGPGCETWGPAHYNCAVQAIEKLQHSLADRDEDLEKNLATIVHLSGRLAAIRERFDKATAAFEREQDRALAAEVRAETAEAALAASREREARMREALITARDHIDMGALDASHSKDAQVIRSALVSTLAEGSQG